MYPRKAKSVGRNGLQANMQNSLHREKIKCLLVNRYMSKFNFKKNVKLKDQFNEEIEELLQSKNVTQKSLHILEKKFSILCKSIDCRSSLKNNIDNEVAPIGTSCQKVNIIPQSEETTLTLPPIKSSINLMEGSISNRLPDTNWSKLIAYKAKKYVDEQKEMYIKEKNKKLMIKEDLLKQIQDKHERIKQEKKQEEKVNEIVKQKINKEEEDYQKQVIKRFEKMKMEREIRDHDVYNLRNF